MTAPAPAAERRALRVGELVREIQLGLAARFPGPFWVEGELGQFRVTGGGHAFGVLKEERALVEIVVWRDVLRRFRFRPAEGMEVLVRVRRVDFYGPHGRLRLQLDSLEPRGAGALARALEELKARLAAEGLFEEARKRRLPFLPRAIGIATASGGAALRDMLRVLADRFADRLVLIRPCRVQGEGAAEEIADALDDLDRDGRADVIIVGRGGGSAEDLSCFNDERVVRAIARCRVPVVSAVGHEIDWTLADLAADVRVPTPTAAAQRVVPERRELEATLADAAERLSGVLRARLDLARARLRAGEASLGAPPRVLDARRRDLEGLARRAGEAVAAALRSRRERLSRAGLGLRTCIPEPEAIRAALLPLGERLAAAAPARVALARRELERQAGRLQALSPLAVLDRGYAIARRGDGSLVRDGGALERGEKLGLRFARGGARVTVEEALSDEEGCV